MILDIILLFIGIGIFLKCGLGPCVLYAIIILIFLEYDGDL